MNAAIRKELPWGKEALFTSEIEVR